jgi:oligo-1,6-glucosidase
MEKKWWHDKIAYQIWPKSFYDSNGDGIGDLGGVLLKLDYLKKLGVDIIWLSPIYASPLVDEGYDISDYYAIGKQFGTMEQFETLLAETKKRGMYVVMDLVVNHCSSDHELFKKALADPTGPYAGYFYFRKGKNGNPPSNYRSYFGGSTWEPVPGSDQYYLHLFAKEQPDLNWENPELRKAVYRMINWWLDKGVAGFRIDAIINIKKVLDFPDYPADGPDGLVNCTTMIEHAEGVGVFLKELKEQTFEPHQAFTVGEVFNVPESKMPDFIGENGYFSSMFDFSTQIKYLESTDGCRELKPLPFSEWKKTIIESQLATQNYGFKANIIENHDQPRGASRWLPSYAQNTAGIQMLGTAAVLLRGIPFIYQGQEIGMRNCRRNSIDEYDDISTKNEYETALRAGLSQEAALERCGELSRDNARTPVQWSSGKEAGFTTGTPWLAVNPSYKTINVEDEERDPQSVLNYYRHLVGLRKNPRYREVLTWGTFEPVYEDTENVFGYMRKNDRQCILVVCNFARVQVTLELPEGSWCMLLANNAAAACTVTAASKTINLPSCAAVVLGR